MKKIILSLLIILLVTGCGEKEEHIFNKDNEKESTSETINKDLTTEETFANAITNFKNATSYKVIEEFTIEEKKKESKYEIDYIVDKKNNIIEANNKNAYYDFNNMKHIINEQECNFGWVYDNMDSKWNINNKKEFLYPLVITEEDIVSFENGVYTLSVSTDKLKGIGDISFEYPKQTKFEIKITLENETIKKMEYALNYGYSSEIYTYTYSEFNKESVSLIDNAKNARYKPFGWQSCNE